MCRDESGLVRALIGYRGESKDLGRFATSEEAKEAYDLMAACIGVRTFQDTMQKEALAAPGSYHPAQRYCW